MKIVILSLVVISIMVLSCKPDHKEPEAVKTTWKLEVTYLDNVIDTIEVEGYEKPQMRIHDGVSIIDNGEFNIEPVASYVKTFNIIK